MADHQRRREDTEQNARPVGEASKDAAADDAPSSGAGIEDVYGIGVQRGDELVWQEESDYWFRLAEGYLGPLPQELRTGPLSHGLNTRKSGFEPVGPTELVTWMSQRGVSAILVDDRSLGAYRSLLESSGMQPAYQGGGISVWRPIGGVWTTSASSAGQG